MSRALRWILPLCFVALTGCIEERTEEGTLPPTQTEAAEAACLADDGAWIVRGPGRMICERQTRDAGKSCQVSSDCETLCLARSRTCAPVTPLLGCNDVLGRDGAVSTLCVE